MFRVCILRAMFESFTRNAQVSIATSTEDVRQNGVEIKHLAKRPGRAGRWTFTGRAALAAAWRWWADVYYFHDPELMLLRGKPAEDSLAMAQRTAAVHKVSRALLRLPGSKVNYDVHE